MSCSETNENYTGKCITTSIAKTDYPGVVCTKWSLKLRNHIKFAEKVRIGMGEQRTHDSK